MGGHGAGGRGAGNAAAGLGGAAAPAEWIMQWSLWMRKSGGRALRLLSELDRLVLEKR